MSEEKVKIVNVKTTNQDEIIQLKFDTSFQYGKAYDALLNKKPSDKTNEFLSLDTTNYKFNLTIDSVLFFYHPDEAVLGSTPSMMNLTIIFSDKQKLTILIAGAKRAKNAYNLVQVLQGKKETNFYVNIPQDDFKFALVKHYAEIKEIYLTEYNHKVAING